MVPVTGTFQVPNKKDEPCGVRPSMIILARMFWGVKRPHGGITRSEGAAGLLLSLKVTISIVAKRGSR